MGTRCIFIRDVGLVANPGNDLILHDEGCVAERLAVAWDEQIGLDDGDGFLLGSVDRRVAAVVRVLDGHAVSCREHPAGKFRYR